MRIRQKLAAIGAALVVAATGAVVAAPAAAEAAPARYIQCQSSAGILYRWGNDWSGWKKRVQNTCRGYGKEFRVSGVCADGRRVYSPWVEANAVSRSAHVYCEFWRAGIRATHPVGPVYTQHRNVTK